jgi:beta-lactamase class C
MLRFAKSKAKFLLVAFAWAIASLSHAHAATSTGQPAVRDAVNAVIEPLMRKYGIPGMAIGVTVDGRHDVYNYGVLSKDTRDPVTDRTLFEIGSFSKTLTATLACYAEADRKLTWSDTASSHLPSLRGSAFDDVSLLNLGTHTSGLPLFVPDGIANDDQLMAYFRAWKPEHPAGTYRTYSNLGIGMLGMIAAESMDQTFEDALEKRLLPALGMTHTYLDVPADRIKDYAQGYSKSDAPVRLNPGVLAAEAYGLKSTAPDLVRFIEANMTLAPIDGQLQRAIACTHTGYYTAGVFVQDLVWEQYPYPVSLKTLLAGNDPDTIYKGTPAAALTPPLPPQPESLLDKTGSTNGFSTYAAFVPAKRIGVVILANKSYPIDARVTAAYEILRSLAGE